MKLYYSTASPYARTAQITLREVGLNPADIEQATHPFNNEVEFILANPLGKVPCLILDDNSALYDSEVICQYLDFTYNNNNLWSPIERNWALRKVYSQVSGLLDVSVALRQEKMREEEGVKSSFWWDRFVTALERGLRDLNQSVSMFPETLSLLHINTVCMLDYLTFRHPEFHWEQYDHLNRLSETYKEVSSFKATLPSG